jgi:hypothetical protein
MDPAVLRRLLCLPCLAVVAVLSACGGSAGSGPGPDPAKAVPRGADLYLEVTLRPDGQTRDDALAAAGKVLDTGDPAARIRSLVQQAGAAADPPIDYAKEIEPWLGDRAGLWMTAGAGAPGVAAAIAVRDAEQARRSMEAIVARSDARDKPWVEAKGDYLLLGTHAEVDRGLRALDGDALADDERYTKALERLDPDRLAHYYMDARGLMDAAMAQKPDAASPFDLVGPKLLAAFAEPRAGSFSADGDRLVLESVAPGGGLAGALTRLGGGSPAALTKALPGDAWAAFGIADAGRTARAVFEAIAGAFGGAAVTSQLRSATGIDLEQDLFAWLGDAAVFARGDREAALDGGVVLEAEDTERAATAFGKALGLLRTRGGLDPRPVRVAGADTAFAARLPDAPKPLVLARDADRVVVAYGEPAAAAALSGDARLEDSEAYAGAKAALDGMDPAGLLWMPAVVRLADALAPRDDADYVKARPYLEAVAAFATGSQTEDGRIRSRVAAGLR